MKRLPMMWLTALLSVGAQQSVMAQEVQGAQPPALTGAAWSHADRAYKAYAKRNYALALREAKAAYRLRPDVARLGALVQQAQTALGQAQEDKAAKQQASNDQTLRVQAQALAQLAYAAAGQGQTAKAQSLIAQALHINKQPLPWHVLHVQQALQAGDWAEVLQAADAGLAVHGDAVALLQAKAHALLQMGQGEQALAVLEQAQAIPAQDGSAVDVLRQSVDVALVMRADAKGLAWLEPLQALDPQTAAGRRVLFLAQQAVPRSARGDIYALPLPAPALACDAQEHCVGQYSFDIERALAEDAYAAAQEQQWLRVRLLAQDLLRLQPQKGSYWQLLIAALQGLGQKPAATEQARLALAGIDATIGPMPAAEMAGIAHVAGDQEAEARYYNQAEQASAIAPSQWQDAAYAATRVGEPGMAARRHVAALDSADAGQINLLPQQRQDLRVAVGDLDRQWGSSAGLFTSRGSTSPGGQSGASGYRSVQTAGDVYWRPPQWRGDGTFVDLYGRIMGNLRASPQESTGPDSAQMALGLRIKPLGQQNLVLAAERWLKLGDASRNDWLLRAAYSYTRNMRGPVASQRWMTSDLYLEAGRYMSSGEKYATSELRYGPQWRLTGSGSGDWGLWGYGVLAAEYNNTYKRRAASSAGLGISLRRWLREDRTHAGRSWAEFTLQYRVRLGGDDRASGLVARANWSF